MGDFELSAAEFRALYQRVRHMSQQGPADRRGALNNTSPTDVVTAASGVWRGHVVSLAAPVEMQMAPDNPDPAVHQMTHTGTSSVPAAGLSFAMNRWSFLCVVAPLRLRAATGPPLNPIAIF